MNNDNQARELVRELLDHIAWFRGACRSKNTMRWFAGAQAYLATPAGSTERPSDAQFYSLISTDLEESACTTESAADANLMREAAGLLVRADKEIAELRSRLSEKATTAPGEGSVSEEDVDEVCERLWSGKHMQYVRDNFRQSVRAALEAVDKRRAAKGGSHE